MLKRLARLLAVVCLLWVPLSTGTLSFAVDYYVDDTNGRDDNSGRHASEAWQTIGRANSASFVPGDRILFKRGGTWREQLIAQGGAPNKYLTYGAYGVGEKPRLLGSYSKNQPDDWRHKGGNVWSWSPANRGLGREMLSEPDLAVSGNGGVEHSDSTPDRLSADEEAPMPGSRQSYFGKNGNKIALCDSGGTDGHVKLYASGGVKVEKGKAYRFIFRARSTRSVKINSIALVSRDLKKAYFSHCSKSSHEVGVKWGTYFCYFLSGATANDAQIAIDLSASLQEKCDLFITGVSLRQCLDPDVIYTDVGNVILNRGLLCGTKVRDPSDLKAQGAFWWDFNNWELKLYSKFNPALYYDGIELALTRHIVNLQDKSNVVLENIDVRYGGGHGISAVSTSHIIIRKCDISFVGGGDQYGNYKVRYGNGIEFWNTSQDTLVENCRLENIYDAALTTQGDKPNTKRNQDFRDNIVSNSEYSLEFWNRGDGSSTENVLFEKNNCSDAGFGWSHKQRWDGPNGRHIMIYSNSASTKNVVIRKNIFDGATESGIRIYADKDVDLIRSDENCWNVSVLAQVDSVSYRTLSDWRKKSGNDMNSTSQNCR